MARYHHLITTLGLTIILTYTLYEFATQVLTRMTSVGELTNGKWGPRTRSDNNPYNLPGHLQVNKTHPNENRWIPLMTRQDSLDHTQPTVPTFMADLISHVDESDTRRSSSSSASSRVEEEGVFGLEETGRLRDQAKQEAEEEKIGWMRGKTVVLYGDSVQRYNLDHFCKFTGPEMIPVPWNSTLGIPYPLNRDPATTPNRPPDPEVDERGEQGQKTPWNQRYPDVPANEGHVPQYCWVEEVDLLVIHVHHYGMDLEDKGTIPPTSAELRINAMLIPVIQSVMRGLDRPSTRRTKGTLVPDLIMANSALWDTARWMRIDMQRGEVGGKGLSSARLNWWRSRVRGVATALVETFPTVPIQWMSHHYPISGNLAWFTDDIKTQDKSKMSSQSANTLIQLVQLREALGSALRDAEDDPTDWCNETCVERQARAVHKVGINRWGDHMLGMEDYMLDALHPAAIPGGFLWGEMMLYDLWQVTR